MRRDKNKKIVFGLIGFGCGIVLSGIIMIVLVLNTDLYQQEMVKQFSKNEQKDIMEQLNAIALRLSQSTPLAEHASAEQEVLETQNGGEITMNEETAEALPPEEKILETATVYIPNNITANKVCEILQQEGIILDAKEFAEYIKAHKKTTYLKAGQKVLPINGDYEVILDLLVIK